MQILKVFFKTIKMQLGSILTSLGIFITINILIAGTNTNTTDLSKDIRANVVILDQDNTEESLALAKLIEKKHNICTPRSTEEQFLQDELYYEQIDYVLTIPSGYAQALQKDTPFVELVTYAVDPKSYRAVYVTTDLEGYFQTIAAYKASGMSTADARNKADELFSKEITTTDLAEPTQEQVQEQSIQRYYNTSLYAAYALPGMIICSLSRIIISLRKKELRDRINCSPVASYKILMGIVAGSAVMSFGIWFIIQIVSIMFSGNYNLFAAQTLFSMLNSFLFTLICVGIAILLSICFQADSFVIDMISNIICLGMSFLCGIFVPQYLLGGNVLIIARFLPAFWYASALNNLFEINGEICSFSYIWKCLGIEALFIAALFTACFAIFNIRKKSV